MSCLSKCPEATGIPLYPPSAQPSTEEKPCQYTHATSDLLITDQPLSRASTLHMEPLPAVQSPQQRLLLNKK